MFEKLFVFSSVERGSNVKGDSISLEVKCGKEAIWKPCVSVTGYTSHDVWTLGPMSGYFSVPFYASVSLPESYLISLLIL